MKRVFSAGAAAGASSSAASVAAAAGEEDAGVAEAGGAKEMSGMLRRDYRERKQVLISTTRGGSVNHCGV